MSKARTASPRARLFWAAGISLACAVFLALGTWQLFRMHWKHELIARVNQRAHAAAVAAPAAAEWPSITADNAEYRHVQVAGTLLLDRSTLVQASTHLGPGFWVMTPLQTASGDIVLVNRGYIADRKAGTGSGTAPAAVSGLLRMSQPDGDLLRKNDPAGQRWYSRDVQAIAAAQGLARVAPYFIDADASPAPQAGQPVGGLTVIAFRDNHLVYALTWYALALMIIGRTWQITRKTRRNLAE
ncbi:SURF1 family protein [Duganella sp. CF458]|uniref:SURF1 family protein n=1 Tax=Duganella sp. CF458 TaxID=1884368 RepID=UPI001E4B9B36|nr:SURF1 family protein [Duganella sp. CF458]